MWSLIVCKCNFQKSPMYCRVNISLWALLGQMQLLIQNHNSVPIWHQREGAVLAYLDTQQCCSFRSPWRGTWPRVLRIWRKWKLSNLTAAEEGRTAPRTSCGIWLCEPVHKVRALCKHVDRHLNPTEMIRHISTAYPSIGCFLAGKSHPVRPYSPTWRQPWLTVSWWVWKSSTEQGIACRFSSQT